MWVAYYGWYDLHRGQYIAVCGWFTMDGMTFTEVSTLLYVGGLLWMV